MKLSHILVEHKYQAEDLQRRLQQGDSFDKLARAHSQCSSSANGGDLGEVPLQRLDETFREAALELEVGEISPIVRTRFGYHLILRQ